MYRDLGYYWLQFAIFVALAIALATIFCDLGTSYGSVQVRVVKYGTLYDMTHTIIN